MAFKTLALTLKWRGSWAKSACRANATNLVSETSARWRPSAAVSLQRVLSVVHWNDAGEHQTIAPCSDDNEEPNYNTKQRMQPRRKNSNDIAKQTS